MQHIGLLLPKNNENKFYPNSSTAITLPNFTRGKIMPCTLILNPFLPVLVYLHKPSNIIVGMRHKMNVELVRFWSWA